MTDFETAVRSLYDGFFKDIGVCPGTGIVTGLPDSGPKKRFATYPYIGSEYGKGNFPRILFVGMDIGSDETMVDSHTAWPANSAGRLQSFKERQMRVMDRIENPEASRKPSRHIEGTYYTALRFLAQECPEWTKYWDWCLEARNSEGKPMTFARLLKVKERRLPSAKSPLSYVVLTNFYKFVTVGRGIHERSKNTKYNDRKFIFRDKECRLLVNEVNVLEADIVIFQSVNVPYREIEEIFIDGRQIWIGPHPGHNQPVSYPGNLTPQGLLDHYQRKLSFEP